MKYLARSFYSVDQDARRRLVASLESAYRVFAFAWPQSLSPRDLASEMRCTNAEAEKLFRILKDLGWIQVEIEYEDWPLPGFRQAGK